jgi:ribosome-associated protein
VAADGSTPARDALRLDHFVKLKAVFGTGGQAKILIQNGEVKVNGAAETRRRRKLFVGDVVEVDGKRFVVE